MILQEQEITIQVNKLSFFTHDPDSANGHLRLDEVAIDGWYDGVLMRRTNEVRPTQWGDFPNRGYLGSRSVSITGVAVAPDRYNLSRLHDDFTSVLINGDYEWMSVKTSSEGERFIKVGLEGTPKWIPRTDTFASFKIDFIAPDPRKYGPARIWTIPGVNYTGGLQYPLTYPLMFIPDTERRPEIQSVGNNGNADAWPIIEVQGDFPSGFQLTDNRGNIVDYSGPVSLSSPVILNFEEGWARQRGQDRTSLLVSREWFPIRPGEAIHPELRYKDIGQGWVHVGVRDTWI